MQSETIYFGAGCFWCSEAAFTRLKGVIDVASGYSGGTVTDPSYEQVSTGTTGYAEVVKVEYDPSAISTRDLLSVFFSIHDPTTLNRQGYDVGTQYRSIIFYTNREQKKVAHKFIKELVDQQTYHGQIVTEVSPAKNFYPADSNHYRYYDQNRDKQYCRVIIDPKIAKLRESYQHLLSSTK